MSFAPQAPSASRTLPHAPALARVLREAADIARATGRSTNTAHVLLALFTVRNKAERLLLERGMNEDRLLDALPDHPREAPDALGQVLVRASHVAAGCGVREVSCLHLLVAITRAREALAAELLERAGEELSALRTRALSMLTGAVPRWLDNAPSARRASTPKGAQAELSHVSALPTRTGRTRTPREANKSTLTRVERAGSSIRRRSGNQPREDRKAALDWSPPLVPPKMSRRSELGIETSRRASEVRDRRSSDTHLLSDEEVDNASTLEPIEAPPLAEASIPAIRPLTEAPAKKRTRSQVSEPSPVPVSPRAPLCEPETDALDLEESDDLEPELAEEVELEAARARSPWSLSPKTYPWLTSLGRNLSLEATQGQLDRLVGREKEVEELIDILGKRRANNPCLIGEPGVGKTAVVEGLAQRLAEPGSPPALREKIIVALDVGALLVGTHLRGSFSEKLQGLKEEVKRSRGRVVVFFDELHTLVGAGSTGDGPQDAANELKTALARGDFPCIGATTRDEFVRHIEPDAALRRRFYPVLIREPSREVALEMIRQIAPAYAEHHQVEYAEAALAAAVTLSARYLTDRHLPDKAIALLDLAGSRAARSGLHSVQAELVARLVAEQTDLPVERLLASDRERLLSLESYLEREVVGHKRQLARIAEVIRRNAAGFSSKRPEGVFLFLGPTGVGKTETAKALAKVLHGSEDMMIRFDLSEFAEPHTVARLVGAPPGYIGHDAGGQLTEAVRRRPGRIVLFDEIEKAHRDVLQVLLQILDEGRLTDGRGQTVSFSETIIIMTSNLGSDVASGRRSIGFSPREDAAELERAVLERAREALLPELWSRIEDRLVFAPLSREELQRIALLLAEDSSNRLMRERGIRYTLDAGAIDYLLDQGGFDATLGARPMRQILSRIVEAPIAARILEGRIHADEHVFVSTRANGGLAFLVGDDRTSLSQRPRHA